MPVASDFTVMDFAMMDIEIILVFVVLPVVLFLMMPVYHDKQSAGSKATSKLMCDVGSDTSMGTCALYANTGHAMKYNEHFFEHCRSLPEELRGGVAQYLNLADVASASASCQILQETLWKSSSVWKVLGTRYDAKIKDLCLNESREAVRVAVWHQGFLSIKDLAMEVKKHPPGAPDAPTSRLLVEASRFIQRLRPCDVFDARDFCELVRPTLSCHSSEASMAAKAFLISSRQSSLPRDVLEVLDDAYGNGLLQQSLLASCIQEYEDMLQAQMTEMEASIEEESKMSKMIDFELDTLLEA